MLGDCSKNKNMQVTKYISPTLHIFKEYMCTIHQSGTNQVEVNVMTYSYNNTDTVMSIYFYLELDSPIQYISYWLIYGANTS